MQIYIISTGMGVADTLTEAAKKAVSAAEMVIGARRLVEAVAKICGGKTCVAVEPTEILRLIEAHSQFTSVCVLMSGDAGFYSGAKRLLPLLAGYNVKVLPGISSVQYFAAKLMRPWQDWRLVSAHGNTCDAAGIVCGSPETFFLTGGKGKVQSLCLELKDAGLGACRVTVGVNLGSACEDIKTGTAAELAQLGHEELAVMLVENPSPRQVAWGLPDNVFRRGNVPMTKSEVRSVILSKLRLRESDVVYDVGAGTGSVSVEGALLVRNGHVYAIEREPEGCRLIKENAKRLGAFNLTCIAGEAPEVFQGLPVPHAAFVGGSSGRLTEILERLLQINPSLRLVVSAVTLETLAEATAEFSRLSLRDVEIVQLSVSRAKTEGAYHLMRAQNPVFIISGVGSDG